MLLWFIWLGNGVLGEWLMKVWACVAEEFYVGIKLLKMPGFTVLGFTVF